MIKCKLNGFNVTISDRPTITIDVDSNGGVYSTTGNNCWAPIVVECHDCKDAIKKIPEGDIILETTADKPERWLIRNYGIHDLDIDGSWDPYLILTFNYVKYERPSAVLSSLLR